MKLASDRAQVPCVHCWPHFSLQGMGLKDGLLQLRPPKKERPSFFQCHSYERNLIGLGPAPMAGHRGVGYCTRSILAVRGVWGVMGREEELPGEEKVQARQTHVCAGRACWCRVRGGRAKWPPYPPGNSQVSLEVAG